MPSATNVFDLEDRRLTKTVEDYSDDKLVMGLLAMLSPYEDKRRGFLLGGQSENAATFTRTLFLEVAARWVPPDAFAKAFIDLEPFLENDDA